MVQFYVSLTGRTDDLDSNERMKALTIFLDEVESLHFIGICTSHNRRLTSTMSLHHLALDLIPNRIPEPIYNSI